VPAGRYVAPRIADAPLLRTVSTVLASPRVSVRQAPFEGVPRTMRDFKVTSWRYLHRPQ